MDQLFCQLLHVAIGIRKELSCVPSGTEWKKLFEMGKKQALVGVCFAAIQRLKPSETLELSETLRLQWLGMTARIQSRNRQMSAACEKVCREFANDGIQSVVLKGQSNLVYYPEDLRECRTSGDIDLWCKSEGGIKGAIEYCKQYENKQGREIPWHRVLYYHCELTSSDGIGIEPHYRPSYLCSPVRNWRLQSWFKTNEQFGSHDAKITQEGQTPLCNFPVPSVEFNAVYQLLHIYKHLFESGIGLRQLLDYYFVLRALHIEQGELADRTESMAQWAEGMGIAIKSNAKIMHTLSRFGMKKFASATMYVLQTVFAMPDEYLICEPNEKEGKFLLAEIMQAGNFGKYDTRIKHDYRLVVRGYRLELPKGIVHAIEKTKHNLRLLTHYPEEVIWEPFFRVYHWIWRRFELWRY